MRRSDLAGLEIELARPDLPTFGNLNEIDYHVEPDGGPPYAAVDNVSQPPVQCGLANPIRSEVPVRDGIDALPERNSGKAIGKPELERAEDAAVLLNTEPEAVRLAKDIAAAELAENLAPRAFSLAEIPKLAA